MPMARKRIIKMIIVRVLGIERCFFVKVFIFINLFRRKNEFYSPNISGFGVGEYRQLLIAIVGISLFFFG